MPPSYIFDYPWYYRFVVNTAHLIQPTVIVKGLFDENVKLLYFFGFNTFK